MDAVLVFSIIAGIIVLGFTGELLFKKTGIPIYIFLILMGIILGPVLGIFSRETIISGLSLFAVLTLMMVLFYGGLNMKISSLLAGGGRAFIQVTIYVLASITIIGLLVSLLLNWDLISSFVFASMVGGETTAAVIIPLSRSLKLRQTTITFLTLESAMNSIFCIVIFFAFSEIYITGTADLPAAFERVGLQFSLAIAIGLMLSVMWIFFLHRFQKQKFTYVLTLGFILATHSVTAGIGGNGQLAVLVFGIFLGNYTILNRISVNKLNMDSLKLRLRKFQEEITFLLETLFFVFLGLTFVLTSDGFINNFMIGFLLLAVLLIVRFAATTVSTYKSDLCKEKKEIIVMCAQGLTPATLAILAVNLQLPHANNFLILVTYVIVFTNVVTTIGSFFAQRKRKEKFGEIRKNLEDLSKETNGTN